MKIFEGLGPREIAFQILNLCLVVSSAYMMWKGMGVYFNTESPIVVVLSESMEPAFARGDLLFLSLSSRPIRNGDIAVFQLDGRPIPIVHRVVRVHERYFKVNPKNQGWRKVCID